MAAKAAPPWRQSKVRLGRSIKLSAGIQTPRNENDLRAGLQNHTPFHASRCATRMKTQWKSTVGILGVLHWMYRPCRRPDSIGSAHRSVTYRCWPSGHCGLHLCDRFLLSDGHTSPGAPPTTVVGTIHLLDALLGWVLFAVGALLVSSGLKSIPYWKPWRAPLMTLAWLSVLLLIVLVLVVVSKAPFGGLAEKAFILDRNIWALLLAVLVFNSPARDGPGRSFVPSDWSPRSEFDPTRNSCLASPLPAPSV